MLSMLVSLLILITLVTNCKGSTNAITSRSLNTSQPANSTSPNESETTVSDSSSNQIQAIKSPTSLENKADLVLINGKIITVDAKDSVVEAVAVKNGKLIKVGTNQEIMYLINSQTDVIDLKGKTVTPGFIDAHFHSSLWGKFDERNIDLYSVISKDEVIRLVAERVKVLPEGQWVSAIDCRFVNKTDWPTKAELDTAAPDNPVFIWHATGGLALVNSYALKLAQIIRNTPNPYGGIIEKDTTGEPNGFLTYSASGLVSKLVPGIGTRTLEEKKADIIRGTTQMLGEGFTSARELGADITTLKEVAKEGKLPMRLTVYQLIQSVQDANQFIANMDEIKIYENDMFQVAGVGELSIDKTSASNQALMYDTTLKIAQDAYPFVNQEDLNKIVSLIHKNGYQLDIHAWGDKAIDMALDAIEAALKETPRPDHRHTIEHFLCPTMQQLHRIKELGVVVSIQPAWILLYQRGHLQDLGDESSTTKREWLIKTMLGMGIPVAFGTDNPESGPFYSPRYGLIGAVTRVMTGTGKQFGPEEAITMQQAIRCYTMGSAYAAFQEKVRGSIEEGKFADMVIWSHDLYSSLSQEDWQTLKAEVTMVSGKVVYKADSYSLTIVKGSTFVTSK
jgi:predicted amidohydrolase YtcJ